MKKTLLIEALQTILHELNHEKDIEVIEFNMGDKSEINSRPITPTEWEHHSHESVDISFKLSRKHDTVSID